MSSDVNAFMNTLLLETIWNTELTFTLQHFKYSELGDPRIITEHMCQPYSVKIVPKVNRRSFELIIDNRVQPNCFDKF